MHLFSTEDLEKKYINDTVWETNFGKIHFKTQRNKFSLRRKCIKSCFEDVNKESLATNKSFWSFFKPFLTNKSCNTQNDILLIDNGKVITEESNLVETFNDHYINIVENLRDKNLETLFLTQLHWKMTCPLTK